VRGGGVAGLPRGSVLAKMPGMKPYVLCHMLCSVDGRILGSRWRPKGNVVAGLFERLHDQLGGGSWLCGRVTAQEFAKGTSYPPSEQVFPRESWFARRDEWSYYIGQIHCTVHMGVPRWMIFFITDVGRHGAHHVEPRIPIWGLKQAEQRVVADAGSEIVLERWTLAKHRVILRRCRLYDYDQHRWLDYDGRPTTLPLLPRGEAARFDRQDLSATRP